MTTANAHHTPDPKDDQITNNDNSVTNKDGDTDLEKGKLETEQKKPDDERVPTVTPDNDNGDPGPPAEKKAVDKGGDKPVEQK